MSPLRARMTAVARFMREVIAAWASAHVAPSSAEFSDGLACFGEVAEAGGRIVASCHRRCP